MLMLEYMLHRFVYCHLLNTGYFQRLHLYCVLKDKVILLFEFNKVLCFLFQFRQSLLYLFFVF